MTLTIPRFEMKRFTRDVALALWKRHKAGETMTALAKEFGVSRQCMSQVFQRYRLERVV